MKTDTLKHIHDHGPHGATFEDKLDAKIAFLRAPGKHVLQANKSHITVTNVGAVSFTDFFDARSGMTHAAHYHADGLSFSTVEHIERIKAAVIGTGPSYTNSPFYWHKDAWSFAGESGMRAMALRKRADLRRPMVNKREEHRREIARFERRDIADEIACIAKPFDHVKPVEDMLAWVRTVPADHDWIVNPHSMYTHGLYADYKDGITYAYIPGTDATTTPPYIRPTYTATVDGDTIKLSSGIKCPFTFSELKASLLANKPIFSKYGAVEVVPTSRDGKPHLLIRCGCHYVDPYGLGLDELLVPTHEITSVDAVPKMYWHEDREKCLERIEAHAAELIKTRRAARAAALAERKQKIAALRAWDRDAAIAEQQAEIDRIDAEIAAFDAATPLGATVEQLSEIVKKNWNACILKPL